MPDDLPVEDSELLRRYVETGAEAAFAELVRRRIGRVYAVALRRAGGDAHRAQDATQAVFTDLARKAATLAARPVLVGWLYRSAQFAAAGLTRAEARRRERETEAHLMQNDAATGEPPADWNRVRPVLGEVLNEIDERDRDGILLRFFDHRPFAEIGVRLRLTENAARMRVERALDKLHAALARRGIRSTTAALSVALGGQIAAASAVPAGFVATVTGAALAQGGAAVAAGGGLLVFMSMTKLQVGIVAALAVAGAIGYNAQAGTNADLRREIATAREQQRNVAALRTENAQLRSAATELAALRADDGELLRLQESVQEVQRQRAAAARAPAVAPQNEAADRYLVEMMEQLNREGNALVKEYKAERDRSGDSPETKALFEKIRAKQRDILELDLRRQELKGAFSYRINNLGDALAAYERATGRKIVRDPSLDRAPSITLAGSKDTGPAAAESIRNALRVQGQVVLEPAADGTLVARYVP